MKVKNEYVKIKTDNKEITLKNYIYDSYLALFSKGQYLMTREIYSKKFLGACYLKFEEELEDYTNADITDFDIVLMYQSKDITGNENSINMVYFYNTKLIYEIDEQGHKTQIQSIEPYLNKKITAIGFGATYGSEIFACIDTSNYSIEITNNSFVVTRKDIISSEANCVGYKYPVHLLPSCDYEKTRLWDYKYPLAKLYSVGFARQKGVIEEEKIYPFDFQIIQESDTEYGVNFKIDANKTIYPTETLYAGNGKYPTKFHVKREIFANKNLQPANNKYPLASNYKYIVFKYRLYYYDAFNNLHIFLDEYYTMNYPIGNIQGLFEVKNKIERK